MYIEKKENNLRENMSEKKHSHVSEMKNSSYPLHKSVLKITKMIHMTATIFKGVS